MLLFKPKKVQSTPFPNLLDSLNLYKDAIIKSVEEDDLRTTDINFSKLISILEYHNKIENRLTAELKEIKKRYRTFKKQCKMSVGLMKKVSVYS